MSIVSMQTTSLDIPTTKSTDISWYVDSETQKRLLSNDHFVLWFFRTVLNPNMGTISMIRATDLLLASFERWPRYGQSISMMDS
ncbi:MAG TPA: hypothetical protein VFR94_05430 [Nitrososphaeraceae archaeon]|nr:hypothetical protein [Nitrososphaeraceae archaeon]